MVTIKDVARTASAPISAVSLILNGKPHTYSSQTEERVRQAAEALGYRPRAYALSMRTGRYNHIAVLMGQQKHSTFQVELQRGLHDELALNGMRIGFAFVDESSYDATNHASTYLSQWASDGFILNYNYGPPSQLTETIEKNRIPAIHTNAKLEHDAVYPREQEFAEKATAELIAQGHRRITYIEPPFPCTTRHFSLDERRNGYQKAMQDAGLRPEVIETDFASLDAPGLLRLSETWNAKNRPTAYVCYSLLVADLLAIKLLSSGFSLPRDFSLVTFREPKSKEQQLPVGKVVVPFYEMGQTAVQLILRKIDDDGAAVPSVSLAMPMALKDGIAPAIPQR